MSQTNLTDRIKPDGISIVSYLENLQRGDYQIPTFQRDIVWEKENVKKLWDSIYKFYPLGSILIWKTDTKLHNHRAVGGHILPPDDSRTQFQYLLDGQQRTTSLLTSIYGGRVEGRLDFDPTLFIDLTIEFSNDVDDTSYSSRFLFWDEIDDKGGSYHRNVGRKKRYDEGVIIKLLDIKKDFQGIFTRLNGISDNKILIDNLWRVKNVLDNYRIALIDLKGITVGEVCQIFERINQAGKPLDIFDIVVAKTYRPKTQTQEGFYLRDLIADFRKNSNNSKFLGIADIDYLQILAILIRENIQDSGIQNITPRYLNDIKSAQIEEIWAETKPAILKVFDFFENHLRIKTPDLIPFRYFYMTLSSYFYKNKTPDYDFIKKYFWYYSLHNSDLLSNTTHLSNHINFLQKQRNETTISFDRFLIDKDRLRLASYSSKGRLSRAILCLYSNHLPKDWKFMDRDVISDNLFFSTDKPNLHHVFPTGYISENMGSNNLNSNSLMNIVYLTQITNLAISDKNPLTYIKDYDIPGFDKVLQSHLLSDRIVQWSRLDTMLENALDLFIEERVETIIKDLKMKLSGINIEVIDTKGTEKPEDDTIENEQETPVP
ncbi:MAG: hypothetical protein MSIBF_04915 [Candidatus Altiarchaeales archaeon IMC4]|nr:MAG: hypothetical protein MSIBF_04915 [Candidatus Altiarchaeales archaeon IMC4]